VQGEPKLSREVVLPKKGSPARAAVHKVELSKEWLAERRKFLADTGAEAYGIPIEPQSAQEDYWGGKLPSGKKVSIGAEEEGRS
jgi:hypothetical protein